MAFFNDWEEKELIMMQGKRVPIIYEAPILYSFCSNCFPFGNIDEGRIEVLN